jgi:hypothetical protein
MGEDLGLVAHEDNGTVVSQKKLNIRKCMITMIYSIVLHVNYLGLFVASIHLHDHNTPKMPLVVPSVRLRVISPLFMRKSR